PPCLRKPGTVNQPVSSAIDWGQVVAQPRSDAAGSGAEVPEPNAPAINLLTNGVPGSMLTEMHAIKGADMPAWRYRDARPRHGWKGYPFDLADRPNPKTSQPTPPQNLDPAPPQQPGHTPSPRRARHSSLHLPLTPGQHHALLVCHRP